MHVEVSKQLLFFLLLLFFCCKNTHKNQREWVWETDGHPDAACWPFHVSFTLWWIQKQPPYSYHGFCSKWFQFFVITLFDLRPAIRNVSLVPLICHWIFPLRLVVFKGIFSYVTRQSMKNLHQKRLLLARPRAGAAGQSWGAGEVSNKLWPSDLACTLEHRRINKQQRMCSVRATHEPAMPEEVQENRRRETEKEIEREGDMIGRKARQSR